MSNIRFSNFLHFKNCNFYTHPNFHSSQLHQDTLFHECTFHNTKSAEAEAAYRTLKQHMEGLHNENMMHEFHALELQSRRHRLTDGKKWWQWIRGKDGIEIIGTGFMEGLSNFGKNLWLPAIWLLISLAYFASVYYLSEGLSCLDFEQLKRHPEWVRNICQSDNKNILLPIAHSTNNVLGPLSLIFKSDAISLTSIPNKAISIFQFVISSLIWFLWVVQIRRRFKM